jgi:hypothetical protein
MVTGFGRYLAAPGRDADARLWAVGWSCSARW